ACLWANPPDTPASEGYHGSDSVLIDLESAILLGLDNHPHLRVQNLFPSLKALEIKLQKVRYDLQLNAGVQRGQSQSQRRLGSSANPFDIKDTTTSINLGLSQLLPSGTNIELSTGISGSVSNLYTDQYAGNVNLTVTQSLLQGVGFGPNLATIRKAELDLELSVSELKGVVEAVTADIETAYWILYLTAEELKIQKKSLQLAEQQLLETQERVNVGKLADLELAAVSAELALRKSQLIDAKSRHEQARLHFIYLIYPDTKALWSHQPLPSDLPVIPEDSLDPVTVHETLGMKFRPDLIQARLALQQEDLSVRQTRNGMLPKLDIFISLGRTTYAETMGAAVPELNSPFSQLQGGVNLEFALRNRQASATYQAAHVSRQLQEIAVENMERLVALEIRSSYVEVVRTRQQVQATQVTRKLQEVKLAAEQEKFRVGKTTNILVLQVQRDYTASQLEEARAVVAYLNALVKLYVAEGTLLERRGIDT
ncbi:MAG: TolC family protein, partial [Candidatus Marinimicrobia bacterium]|nr:TolC family protein [Candidatus Neomarinimicrobiota bacterium]